MFTTLWITRFFVKKMKQFRCLSNIYRTFDVDKWWINGGYVDKKMQI